MNDIKDFGRTSFVTHTTGLIERLEKCTMNEQEKILAVLDMSEDEQWKWLYDNHHELVSYLHIIDKQKHLADLAFRLRDEAVAKNHVDFHEAIYDVMMKVEGCEKWATAFWGECIAKPIHWILAVLIAKTKESNNDND